jgi:hypothetical protein
MAGVKGKSGGKRPGAGRRRKYSYTVHYEQDGIARAYACHLYTDATAFVDTIYMFATAIRIESVYIPEEKKSMKAGKNVWINWELERVKTDTRPGPDWHPCYPESRVRGDTYTPYRGTTAWEQAANAAMAEQAASNFQRG